MDELYEMALKLLKMYKEVSTSLIWQYSEDIVASEYRLEDECNRYKFKIERAYHEEKSKNM